MLLSDFVGLFEGLFGFFTSLKPFIFCMELGIALVYSWWILRIRPCLTLEGLLEISMLIPPLTLICVGSVGSPPIFLAIDTQPGGLVWPWIPKSELHRILWFFLGNMASHCSHFFDDHCSFASQIHQLGMSLQFFWGVVEIPHWVVPYAQDGTVISMSWAWSATYL